jgi:hypothetical protein
VHGERDGHVGHVEVVEELGLALAHAHDANLEVHARAREGLRERAVFEAALARELLVDERLQDFALVEAKFGGEPAHVAKAAKRIVKQLVPWRRAQHLDHLRARVAEREERGGLRARRRACGALDPVGEPGLLKTGESAAIYDALGPTAFERERADRVAIPPAWRAGAAGNFVEGRGRLRLRGLERCGSCAGPAIARCAQTYITVGASCSSCSVRPMTWNGYRASLARPCRTEAIFQ